MVLYQILEFNEILSQFSYFKKKYLFKEGYHNYVNFDFKYEENIITNLIEKKYPLKRKIKSCLVKKVYHAKGKIIINEIKKAKDFKLILYSNLEREEEMLNKI